MMDNSQKFWSFEELRSLCAAKGLPDSKVYQDALWWKKWRACYHEKQYNEIWRKLLSSSDEITVGGSDWNEAQWAAEAHVEAEAQVLHSMADILAQIINKVVLNSSLPEKGVHIYSVRNKLGGNKAADKILVAVNELLNSMEFKYVDASVNTIKHRRLLDRVFHAEGGKNTRNDHDLCFREFKYKGEHYSFTWAKDIAGPYKRRVFELICKIGNTIKRMLKKSRICCPLS